MNKDNLKLNQNIYYNTAGANQIPISQQGYILDIGQKYVWVMIKGNLGPIPVMEADLSEKPKHKVTNRNIKFNI